MKRAVFAAIACSVMSFLQPALADPSPTQIAAARVRLDCLLQRQLRERESVLASQRDAQAHLEQVQDFRARQTNPQAVAVAAQAIVRDQNALRQIAARLELVDRGIANTRRALANLVPSPRPPSMAEQARRAGNVALANALHCGDQASNSRINDLSLPSRLLVADFCGDRTNEEFERSEGRSRNAALIAELNRIVARLDAVSAASPVRLLDGCTTVGGGAFSSSNASYITECEMTNAATVDEIAVIVAHERAHVQLQHVTLTALAGALVNAPLPAAAAQYVFDSGFADRLARFGRAQELEADVVAVQNVLMAGYSPRAIDAWLTRMQAEDTRTDSTGDDTHPTPGQRRRALEAVFGARFWEDDPSTGACPSR